MDSVLKQLSSEHQMLAETVRAFANEVVAPVAALHDQEQTFPYEIVKGMADMGLFALPFPEEIGGMGGDYLSLCLAIEELAGLTKVLPSHWKRQLVSVQCQFIGQATKSRKKSI
jgi:alkylation response protein AidB-like acyl-CoA dehydrogenase